MSLFGFYDTFIKKTKYEEEKNVVKYNLLNCLFFNRYSEYFAFVFYDFKYNFFCCRNNHKTINP